MNDYDDYRGAYQSNARANFYEKDIYNKDGYDNFLWRIEQTALTPLLKETCPSFENIDVLDFACGTGRICEYLEQYVEKFDALDISDEMVQIAKAKTKNVNYIIADIINDPDALSKKYDLITTFRFVLFAEPDLRKAIFDKLAGALNGDSGRLVVGLHGNPYSRRGLVLLYQKLKGTLKEKQLRSFSLKDMQVLASSAGLEIVTYRGVGFIPRKMFAVFGAGFCNFIESILNGTGLFKFFGSNLIVVCKLKS